ncbi:MAG: SDR family NAD(P)-dependent oxidoreductase [Gammaproteobacteria bacterium]|nr:SDR family NAD(P)-dependent oxidoreductase [Gammaproteobacteria bacterium]
MSELVARYGRWAVVAGASEGIGAAFARSLAERGMDLLLIARQERLLRDLAAELREDFAVETRCLVQDLGDDALAEVLARTTRDLDVGMVIYNAAFVPVGRFVDIGLSDLQKLVRVNVRGPVTVLSTLLPAMVERRRGAVVLMSSLAGFQGSPRIAGYAASKAFNTILGESLWEEVREHGVDVIACCAGATSTPGYRRAFKRDPPGPAMMTPLKVAEQTLAALGRGPRVVPGFFNRIVAEVTTRLVPRRAMIRTMARAMKDL